MKVILFLVLLIHSSLFAITETQIKNEMSTKIDQVLNILQQENGSNEQKAQKVFVLMDQLFDFNAMSQISLGKKWREFTKEQRAAFSKAFEQKLKNSFVSSLKDYNNQEMIIHDAKKVNPKRIKLLTELVGEKENFPILYKFYKKRGSQDWLIYDVEIIGVSILSSYRQQFAAILQNRSIDSLIEEVGTLK